MLCNQIIHGTGVARNRDVLISGAGVAGLALAYWLRRFGFTPVVVERAPRRATAAKRSTYAARPSKWPVGWGHWRPPATRAPPPAGCPM